MEQFPEQIKKLKELLQAFLIPGDEVTVLLSVEFLGHEFNRRGVLLELFDIEGLDATHRHTQSGQVRNNNNKACTTHPLCVWIRFKVICPTRRLSNRVRSVTQY